MAADQFVHLHLHSEYSLLDGLSRVEELVRQAAKLGMPALALTDHGVLYGAIDFYLAAKSAGIKPIIGVEAYIAPRGMAEKTSQDRQYSHLVLLARDLDGYKNLLKLVTKSHLEGYFYRPRIDRELLAQHARGLIALSGCPSGDVARAILRDDLAAAREAAAVYRDILGPDSFWLELQSHGLVEPDEAKIAQGKLQLSREMGIPVVATNDVHYTFKEGAQAQDLLLCIQTNSTIDDAKRMRMERDEFYLKSPAEMARLFSEIPEALRNTLAIAEQCDLQLKFDRLNFPELGHVVPPGVTPQEHLERLCRDALPERYPHNRQRASERLEYELDVIRATGFAAYILFVWDFVRWAREQGILCGPRGSAAGAIVLYLLGITQVDPLEYGLTFERFLNPERVQMPDIDMDFPDDRRDEVIEYVVNRYGRDHVAQIVTFGRLAARAAIRDVGRALGFPLSEVDRVAKLIPTIPVGTTIAQALEGNKELKELYDSQPHLKRLIDAARSVEGVARHASTHAAGVVVSGEPLVEHVPLQKVAKSDGGVMTQYHMKALEKIGLLKMDFLGLANLTMLDKAVKNIQATRGITIDPAKLPLDDRKTFEALSKGDSKTVFQLEGSGMTRYLKELKPQTVQHLAAMVALYRPGPMAHIPEYIARKEGRSRVQYPHPSLEEVLKESYGIIVYQDQVLQVVRVVAGYSLGQADILRRAMGKKLPEEMKRERSRFLEGARARGYPDDVANQIWEYIEPFAGYAFNKCVVGSTIITDALTGERTTVGSLFTTPRPFVIHALGADGTLRPRRVTAVMANGTKPVYELRTAQGHRIVATANHPFRTLAGWTNLADLKPGDRIAAPRQLRIEGGERWPRHELIVLAGLLAKGSTGHPSALSFASNDPSLIDDFVQAATRFPDTVAHVTVRENGRRVVYLKSGRETRFAAGERTWKAAGGAATLAPPHARSGAGTWAEQLGIVGCQAADKRIPAPVFRLRDEDLELFLGRLWSGDGFIANRTSRVPFYAATSEELARGIQALLLRLGIVSGVHNETFSARGRRRLGWTVRLVGERSVEAFVRRVLPHVVGRDEAVAILRAHLDAAARRQASLGSERLRAVADSDVFWDRVVSITPQGEAPTYDLTVEEDHNFVADGLIVHNSHAVMYAQIAYQTAYLKANYPVEWMAAVLSTEALNTDRVVSVIAECRRMGIPLLPPSVNRSERGFTIEAIPTSAPEGKQGIRYGLAAIKNVGEGAVEAIIAERQRGGPFRDLADFCRRMDLKTINKRVLEALVKAGAMDELGDRARLLAGIDQCMAAAQQAQKASSQGQVSLFEATLGPSADPIVTVELPRVEPLTERQRLLYEKESLGLYLSTHPFQAAAQALEEVVSATISELGADLAGQKVTVAGLVVGVRRLTTKKGDAMLVAEVEDLTGSVEVIAFPRTLEKTAELWREDAVLIVEGKLDLRDDRPQIICDAVREWREGEIVIPMGGASPAQGSAPGQGRATAARRNGHGGAPASDGPVSDGPRRAPEPTAPTPAPAAPVGASAEPKVRLVVPRTGHPVEDLRLLEALHALLSEHPGDDPYELVLSAGTRRVRLTNPTSRLAWTPALAENLRALLGPQNVEMLPPPAPVEPASPPAPSLTTAGDVSDGPPEDWSAPEDEDDELPPIQGLRARDDLEHVRNWWGET